MSINLMVLPGDGIGPEITAVTVKALQQLDTTYGLALTLDEHSIGLEALERHGTTFRDETLDAARAEPPLPKGDPTQIEAWYRWALEYPGSGLTEFCGEPEFVKRLVRAKIEKGLL